jgi:hypothetical protein
MILFAHWLKPVAIQTPYSCPFPTKKTIESSLEKVTNCNGKKGTRRGLLMKIIRDEVKMKQISDKQCPITRNQKEGTRNQKYRQAITPSPTIAPPPDIYRGRGLGGVSGQILHPSCLGYQ